MLENTLSCFLAENQIRRCTTHPGGDQFDLDWTWLCPNLQNLLMITSKDNMLNLISFIRTVPSWSLCQLLSNLAVLQHIHNFPKIPQAVISTFTYVFWITQTRHNILISEPYQCIRVDVLYYKQRELTQLFSPVFLVFMLS